MCRSEEELYHHRSLSKRRKTFYIYDVLKETCGQLMKAKYIILEALLLRGMKIVLDSICAKEEATASFHRIIVFENHSKKSNL